MTRTMRNWLPMAMAVILCAAFSAPASAGVVYSTLGPGGQYDPTAGYYIDGSDNFNQVIANQFVLGFQAQITNVVLAVGNNSVSNVPLNVYLETDSVAGPGAVVTQLVQVGNIPSWGNGNGGGLVTFNCVGGAAVCTLNPGTYWVVASEPDAATQQIWDYAYQDSFGTIAFNQVGDPFGSWIGPFDFYQNAFEVNATPEPGTLVLLGTGLVGLAGVVRRRMNF